MNEGGESIGQRLREERKRQNLSQEKLADVGGVSRRTLIDWEKGVASPTALALRAFDSEGLDTHYIVSGRRNQSSRSAAGFARQAETEIDDIDGADLSRDETGFADKLKEYALDARLPDRTKARADRILARHGDADAIERMEARDRRRDEAYKTARRTVREARFVVDWEPPELLEAALIRLVVNFGADGPAVEEILRAVREAGGGK